MLLFTAANLPLFNEPALDSSLDCCVVDLLGWYFQMHKILFTTNLRNCSVNVNGSFTGFLDYCIIRLHRSTTYVDAAYCYRPSSVVCRSVCHSSEHPFVKYTSSNDCLVGKRENYQVCSVQQLCTVQCTHIWTDLTVVCWLNLAFLWLYYVLQFICVRFSFFSTMPRDWLRRRSMK